MGKVISGGAARSPRIQKFYPDYFQNQELSGSIGPSKPGDPKPKTKKSPPIATEKLKGVTVHGSKSKVGANDQKVLNELKDSGRASTSIKAATKTYGKKVVKQHLEASGADTALYNKTRAYKSAGPDKGIEVTRTKKKKLKQSMSKEFTRKTQKVSSSIDGGSVQGPKQSTPQPKPSAPKNPKIKTKSLSPDPPKSSSKSSRGQDMLNTARALRSQIKKKKSASHKDQRKFKRAHKIMSKL